MTQLEIALQILTALMQARTEAAPAPEQAIRWVHMAWAQAGELLRLDQEGPAWDDGTARFFGDR